jgi:hypothetical protein
MFGTIGIRQADGTVKEQDNMKPLRLVKSDPNRRAIVVSGSELISPKLLALCGVILDFDSQNSINNITFRNDGLPQGDNGTATHATGSIAINLEYLWHQIVETAKRKECAVSISGLWTLYVMATVAHEAWHLEMAKQMGMTAYSALTQEKRDEMADDYAEQMLSRVARLYNIEPEMLKDEPFLGHKMSALFISEADNPWVAHQRIMIEQGLMYKDQKGLEYKSLRKYVRAWDVNKDSKDWGHETFAISITYHDGAPGTQNVFAPPVNSQPPPPTMVVPMAAAAGNVGAIALANDGLEGPKTIYVDDMGEEGRIHRDEGAEDGYGEHFEDPEPPPVVNTTTAAVQQQAPVAAKQYKVYPRRFYAPNAYSNEQLEQFGALLYARLQQHIFIKCGWDGRGGFTNPNAIMEPVRIDDIVPPDFVMECEAFDANGRFSYNIPCGVSVKGQVLKNTGLPAYVLHLNARGTGLKRKLIPQNPNKGTPQAQLALQGHRIVWVIKDDQDGDVWFGSFTDDIFTRSGKK